MPNPVDTADIRKFRHETAYMLGSSIRRIVIDKYCFPRDIGEVRGKYLNQRPDIFTFIKGGNNDREFERSGRFGGLTREGDPGYSACLLSCGRGDVNVASPVSRVLSVLGVLGVTGPAQSRRKACHPDGPQLVNLYRMGIPKS